jgi:glutathione S-transferase
MRRGAAGGVSSAPRPVHDARIVAKRPLETPEPAMTDLPKPLRLHTVSTAPNPRRVAAFMACKGITLPLVEYDMGARAHYAPEYIALAGRPVIPALELDSGEVLTETIAICRYLEAFYLGTPLFGADPLAAARIEMWQRRAEFELLLPVAAVFRHSHPAMAGLEDQVPDWADGNRARVLKGFATLDARLAISAHLGGEGFSVADITAYVTVDFSRVTKIAIPAEMTALLAWRDRMAALACFARPAKG